MRRSVGFAALSLIALAGCATPDTKAPATAVSADAQQATEAAVKKQKSCLVGSRVCTAERQVDPSVLDMDGASLGDARRGREVSGRVNP